MDLALELGFRTVAQLRREMTERELGQWEQYARRRWLPKQRLELLLANLARIGTGAKELAAFVMDPALRERLEPPSIADAEAAQQAVTAIAGRGRVVHLNAVPIGQERRVSNG
jgi:hypothetical protein